MLIDGAGDSAAAAGPVALLWFADAREIFALDVAGEAHLTGIFGGCDSDGVGTLAKPPEPPLGGDDEAEGEARAAFPPVLSGLAAAGGWLHVRRGGDLISPISSLSS